jgi:hypothetical protein
MTDRQLCGQEAPEASYDIESPDQLQCASRKRAVLQETARPIEAEAKA